MRLREVALTRFVRFGGVWRLIMSSSGGTGLGSAA